MVGHGFSSVGRFTYQPWFPLLMGELLPEIKFVPQHVKFIVFQNFIVSVHLIWGSVTWSSATHWD